MLTLMMLYSVLFSSQVSMHLESLLDPRTENNNNLVAQVSWDGCGGAHLHDIRQRSRFLHH